MESATIGPLDGDGSQLTANLFLTLVNLNAASSFTKDQTQTSLIR
jgi:hypothetical protein